MNAKVIRYDFKARRRLPDNDTPAQVLAVPTSQAQEKLEYFGELLNTGKTSVALNPAYPGVSLPEHLMSDPHVVIDWSLRFGLVDFVYDLEGVRGTLSFNREPCFINIPWESVFLIRSTGQPSNAKEWRVQQTQQPMDATQIATILKQAFESAGLQAKFVTTLGAPKESNEPTNPSPPSLEPNPIRHFFGRIGSLFNKIFSKRV